MRWSYKTIHYELKKEGLLGSAFLDEPEIELSLNQYGKAGWELVSLLETLDGIIAVFKQPLTLDTRSFSSQPKSSPEKRSQPSIGIELETETFASQSPRKQNLARQDEDAAEAMMLDDFEIIDEKEKGVKNVTKPSAPPADIGLIRIE